ncbi:MAG: hypothetical protein AB7U85_02155 [Alphaproteobacteria bacterium]
MLYEASDSSKSQRMFEATLSYITSKDISIEERKMAVDFFVDYVKNNHQEKVGIMVLAIKHICNNAPEEFRRYCKKVLPYQL